MNVTVVDAYGSGSPAVCLRMLSPVRFFETPWTVSLQASQSTEFPRQEYWSELLFPTPGNLSDPGIESVSFASPALAGGFFTTARPGQLGPPAKAGYLCCAALHVQNPGWTF